MAHYEFKKVLVQPDSNREWSHITLTVCTNCGDVVADRQLHDEHHDAIAAWIRAVAKLLDIPFPKVAQAMLGELENVRRTGGPLVDALYEEAHKKGNAE